MAFTTHVKAEAIVVQEDRTTEISNLSPEARGDILMLRGSYAAAIDAYQQAWPRSAQLWNKTGLAYHHLYALDEAQKDYQMALSLDPHFADAYNNLGAVYHGKREYGIAEKDYKRALKYQPKSAVSYCNLGTAYFAEHKFKKGIKAYQKAIDVDPQAFSSGHNQIQESTEREARIATAYSLAKVYAAVGRNQEALASLHKALSAGFNNRKLLMSDKEFASLRETTEFRQLMVEEHLE
jgi:tetratricopeptide (TPR) repeat protein